MKDKLKEAQDRLIEADIHVRNAYIELTKLMGDKEIPLKERYSVMGNKELSEHFQLVETEWMFDVDDVAEIDSWE